MLGRAGDGGLKEVSARLSLIDGYRLGRATAGFIAGGVRRRGGAAR